jgi:hypothetical protein
MTPSERTDAEPCDDCGRQPCVCEPRLKWLTAFLRESGPVTITHTEEGELGVWLGPCGETDPAWAVGETVEDLLDAVIAREPDPDRAALVAWRPRTPPKATP